jgi:4-hydroxybenzoate polyprenyltransferase
MKKEPFVIFLIVALLLAMIAMGLLLSDIGAWCYLVAVLFFAVVLSPFFIRLKKAEDETKKAKIRRNMLLVLLIPIVIAILVIVTVVVSLLLYFA